MCSTFSYLPIIFFRCCLTPSFYRGHFFTTPNNAQTYRGKSLKFHTPPKTNGWSHLIIPFFRGTKVQKSLATEVSPTVFAMPKESRKSVMMPVALQASQSELSTFCSIWKSNYTPPKKTWTSMDSSDYPQNDGLLEKWWKMQCVGYFLEVSMLNLRGLFFHNCYMIWSNRMAWSWIESKPSYGSLITLSLHLPVSTLEILQQSAADDQYESTVAELPSCNCGSKEARRLFESSLLE